MPLRLASACLPAARDAVLGSAAEWSPQDEDDRDATTPTSIVPPHSDLLAAAESLPDGLDAKFDLLLPVVSPTCGAGSVSTPESRCSTEASRARSAGVS